MSRDGKDLTLSVERRERDLRRAVMAAAVERPVTAADVRPGMRPDIAAALAEHGRIMVCPRPDQVRPIVSTEDERDWRKAALLMARARASDWTISQALGVPQQAVRNLLGAERRRRERARIAGGRSS